MVPEYDHQRWLLSEEQRLLAWGRRSRTSLGFGYLDTSGEVDLVEGSSLLITARMTFVFALASMRENRTYVTDASADATVTAAADAAHGVAALAPDSPGFWDEVHGGWMSSIPAQPNEAADASVKSAYDHAFVLVAAAAATVARIPGAAALLDSAMEVVLTRFWNESDGALVESFSWDWSAAEGYRGANSNMHFVEACLATYAATADSDWLTRALRVSERLINQNARNNGWRLLEHYDAEWHPLPDFNAENPNDQFRPFGYLVGHSFEWARLLTQLSWALKEIDSDLPWLSEAARALWSTGLALGRSLEGIPGFVYSLNWLNEPVISSRLHWVISEAVAAALTLYRDSGDPDYFDHYQSFWAEIRRYFVDEAGGSWHHELDSAGVPRSKIWKGKPDLYHAYGAVVLSLVAATSTIVTGTRQCSD